MSIWALTSLAESPGVTTTALAVAGLVDPAAILVEADPFGGPLAARFGLGPRPGLASLAAARRDRSADALRTHAQVLPGGLQVVVGLPSLAQTPALAPDWESLAAALAAATQPVVLDAGRFLAGELAPVAVLRRAEVVAVVLRPELSQIARVRASAELLAEINPALSLVLVGDRPYGPGEVAAATGIPIAGVIAHDPSSAALLGGAPGSAKALRRSALARSAAALAASLAAATARPEPTGAADPSGVIDLTDVPAQGTGAVPVGEALR